MKDYQSISVEQAPMNTEPNHMYQSIVEDHTELSRTIVNWATPRMERRTSTVGDLIRDKTFKAFMKSGKEQGINEKQAKALNRSSILAFNNNFL